MSAEGSFGEIVNGARRSRTLAAIAADAGVPESRLKHAVYKSPDALSWSECRSLERELGLVEDTLWRAKIRAVTERGRTNPNSSVAASSVSEIVDFYEAQRGPVAEPAATWDGAPSVADLTPTELALVHSIRRIAMQRETRPDILFGALRLIFETADAETPPETVAGRDEPTEHHTSRSPLWQLVYLMRDLAFLFSAKRTHPLALSAVQGAAGVARALRVMAAGPGWKDVGEPPSDAP
jgi:hypothetical protein